MTATRAALLVLAISSAMMLGLSSGCSKTSCAYRVCNAYGDYYMEYFGYPEDTYYYYDRQWSHPRAFVYGAGCGCESRSHDRDACKCGHKQREVKPCPQQQVKCYR